MLKKDEQCTRCQEKIDHAQGFTGINFSVGRTAVEQLRNGRVVFLCATCSNDLKGWLDDLPSLRTRSH